MPYRNAHWWVMAVLAVIFVGFWPTYWSIPREVRWEHHLHGVVATVWVLMVIAQSWSAHNKRLPVHRAVGQSSLFLFPFLLAGLFAVQATNADSYVEGSPFLVTGFGQAFLPGLLVAFVAYVTLYYRALKYRRKVWSHSAYLLGTPMILFESPAGRMINNLVPGMGVEGPADFPKVMHAIMFCDGLMVAIALTLWWKARARSNAWAVVASFIAAQMLVFAIIYYGGLTDDRALRAFATIPTWVMVATGFVIGAATSWFGWQAGKRPSREPAMPAAGSAAA